MGNFKYLILASWVVILCVAANPVQAKKIDPSKKCTVIINDDDINEMNSIRRFVHLFNKAKERTCITAIEFLDQPFNIVLNQPLVFKNANDEIQFSVTGSATPEKRVVINLSGLSLGTTNEGSDTEETTYGITVYDDKARFNYLTLKVKDKDQAKYAISNKGEGNVFSQVRIVDPADKEIATVSSADVKDEKGEIISHAGEITIIDEPKPEVVDTDNDSIPDDVDNCDDVKNEDQKDSDEDDVGDACDAIDTDGDNVEDAADNCVDKANEDQADFDEDVVGDACDTDNDRDGVEDTDDNCPPLKNNDGTFKGPWSSTKNADQADVDSDTKGDVCDSDSDGDGIDDADDNCPEIGNPDQLDKDGDGMGAACDGDGDKDPVSDVDGDGISYDPNLTVCSTGQVDNCSDNCPNDANSDQLDSDGDYKSMGGNACDADDDNDAVTDADEDKNQNGTVDEGETSPINPDTDNDLVIDNFDNCPLIANPAENGLQIDSDADNIGDACDSEVTPNPSTTPDPSAVPTPTVDPNVTDTDSDTVVDASDNCLQVANTDQADSDADSIGDACDPDNPEADSDSDTIKNGSDNCKFTINNDQADTDKDGTGDACDSNTAVDPQPKNDSGGCMLNTGSASLNPSWMYGLVLGLLMLRRKI